jgi:hypothetical protein
MRPHEIEAQEFLGRLYRSLVGATVLAFRWDGEFPVFTVRLTNGERREISIQQDPEGNGPGFIEGLDD